MPQGTNGSPSLWVSIRALDQSVLKYGTEEDANTEKISDARGEGLLRSLLGAFGIAPTAGEPPSNLLKDHLPQPARHMIAVGLLRILAKNPRLFDLREHLRRVTFELFDTEFARALYGELHLNASDQAFQKRPALMKAVASAESQLEGALGEIQTLEAVANVRQAFMRELNSVLGRELIKPFLPPELFGPRLDELFRVVEGYKKSEGRGVLDEARSAKSSLDAFAASANEYDIEYVRRYLVQLANLLTRLIDQDLERNPLAQPARLEIIQSDKRYPLHSLGKDFPLYFSVVNRGPGRAEGITIELIPDAGIEPLIPSIQVGELGVEGTLRQMPCRITESVESAYVLADVAWRNFDGSVGRYSGDLQLKSQRSDVPWDDLESLDPYSLEPVSEEENLAGRSEDLDKLAAIISRPNVGSAYVTGQKRVGKTSVVRTLQSRISARSERDMLIIYVESGDYVHPDAERTIDNLVERLCHGIKVADKRFAQIVDPVCDGALSPLARFLEQIAEIAPDLRVIFVLDEFDALPLLLYERGPTGDSFFQTIRAIANKPRSGFILVGGEKLIHVVEAQGQKLNKFQRITLDYLTADRHYHDFQEMIRRPIARWIEITDLAIESLHKETAGNPYFAKFLANELFRLLVQRRDCQATPIELDETVASALAKLGSETFQHFWDDGIFATGAAEETVSMRRRCLLLAFSEILRGRGSASFEDVIARSEDYGVSRSESQPELRDLIRRQILLESQGHLTCKVPLFQRWLADRGPAELISTFKNPEAIAEYKREQERVFVSASEIRDVVGRWGTYKGAQITEDKVRAWLAQFGDLRKQRLMFTLLSHVRFYSHGLIRQRLKEAHGIVVRGLVSRIEGSRQRRSDILIGYLDGPGKSGANYARLYAEENRIHHDRIVEKAALGDAVKRDGIQALVFLDDFIGTGQTAGTHFKEIVSAIGDELRERNIKVRFVAICGFAEGLASIERTVDTLGLSAEIHVCDGLAEAERVFSEESKIWASAAERAEARNLVESIGRDLEPRHPLGYHKSEAAIVFEFGCPNNSLPILWKKTKTWMPLFERY